MTLAECVPCRSEDADTLLHIVETNLKLLVEPLPFSTEKTALLECLCIAGGVSCTRMSRDDRKCTLQK